MNGGSSAQSVILFCSREKQFQLRERKEAQGSSPAHPGTMHPESSGEIRPSVGPLPSACPFPRAEPEPWTSRWRLDNWKTQHCSPRGSGKPWRGVEHAHPPPPHHPTSHPRVPSALLPCLEHLCSQSRCFGCQLHLTESSLRPQPFRLLSLPPRAFLVSSHTSSTCSASEPVSLS